MTEEPQYLKGNFMKAQIILAPLASLLLVSFLSGCAGLVPPPPVELSWGGAGNNLAVTAIRIGCEVGGVKIKNNGSKETKVFGTIDILDANSNGVSTISFHCENVYPGGTRKCGSNQKYTADIYAYPGYFCDGSYSQFKLKLH